MTAPAVLVPAYCSRCGRALVMQTRKLRGHYDSISGERKQLTELVCPTNADTNVLRWLYAAHSKYVWRPNSLHQAFGYWEYVDDE